MSVWIDSAFVAEHADVSGVEAESTPLINATAAAIAYVQRVRADLPWTVEGWSVSADVKLGTAMLAWRFYQRKDAPLGIVTNSTGDPVEILREDPDIARLLGVNTALGYQIAGPLWSNAP